MDSVDAKSRAPYSDGMISEFHDLSAKIDQLAEMTQALRRENAVLRQANTMLLTENRTLKRLLDLAQVRLLALLAKLPLEVDGEAEAAAAVAAHTAPDQAAHAGPDAVQPNEAAP